MRNTMESKNDSGGLRTVLMSTEESSPEKSVQKQYRYISRKIKSDIGEQQIDAILDDASDISDILPFPVYLGYVKFSGLCT